MKPLLLALALVPFLLKAFSTFVGAADQVGIVKFERGRVAIERGGTSFLPLPNERLYRGDVVHTGADGTAGLILEDDTVIALGPKSSVAIEDFLYRPAEMKLSLVARVIKGTISFLSGRIAKLAPSVVHIKTPTGTVGVRGTHLLVKVD